MLIIRLQFHPSWNREREREADVRQAAILLSWMGLSSHISALVPEHFQMNPLVGAQQTETQITSDD